MAGPIITPTRPPEPDEEDSVSRAPARERGRSRVALLGVAVSVLAVGGVVWWALQQEPPQFPDSPGEWGALAGAIALYAVATLVRGERWHALLRAEEARPAREDSHGLNVVGYAANNVLPARAGDAVRVFLMAPRAATSKKAVLGTLLAERLLDIAVILTLFVVVGYGLLGEAGAGELEWVALVTAAVVAAGVTAVWLVRRSERLHAIAAPVLASTLRLRGHHGGRLLAVTLVIWALEAGVWMSAGAAAGFRMDPIEGCYVVALASVFALIPSGPGYAGTQDAAAITGILALGGTESQALTYVILVRFVLAVPITLAGLGLLAARYGGLRRLRGAR
ncbi:MAG TPA: lysylphosphatidylglycerol synthase transmembrane domain-containing protein [Solirubrobacteraceae bacterium]|nr:lysylphosphatidylglycerol synthase transmembrane domain-containing protein [Solirubrobacteraceae bacterium]